MQRHAQGGFLEHRQIICPIANRCHGIVGNPQLCCVVLQGPDLGLSPKDRLAHCAGQLAVGLDQDVGTVAIKPQMRSDPASKGGETA